MKRHTRSSENFQYRELSPHRRGKRTSEKVQETLVYTRRARSTPPVTRIITITNSSAAQVQVPKSRTSPAQMARAFAAFNQGSPLNLNQHDDIPVAALKSLPYFLGENQVTPIEHIQDVANLCALHHITEDNVVVRLLAASFKGKALEWYRRLATGSIADWDQLGGALCDFFKDNSDYLSLVQQLATIQRAPYEQVSNLTLDFKKLGKEFP